VLERIHAGLKRVFGLHHPGRELKVFPDDIFIVSYPKSGNTWTRFLIANLIHPNQPADFGNINDLIPDPEALSQRKIDRMPRPRVIKSHQYFDPRYPKVIYIVRDPRDVAVSQYHFQRKRRLIPDDYPIERFVESFIAGETSPYASWGENVGSWLFTRYHKPTFLLLRYEDLISGTLHELSKVASFVGRNPDPVLLAQAIERSSADAMRKLEKKQARLWSSTKDTRQDVPFVRTARAGGWSSELPERSIAELETTWGRLMTWLGYELASGHKSSEESWVTISAAGERAR
jgi:hypothetical protein